MVERTWLSHALLDKEQDRKTLHHLDGGQAHVSIKRRRASSIAQPKRRCQAF